MELKDLAGEHMIDAVDFSTKSINIWGNTFEDSRTVRFRVGGVVYVAIEDPEDGYRSSMSEVKADPAAKMENEFPPVKVEGVYIEKEHDEWSGRCDIIKFVCAETKQTILEIGTNDTDDYYPYFVSNFYPENMPINRKESPRQSPESVDQTVDHGAL